MSLSLMHLFKDAAQALSVGQTTTRKSILLGLAIVGFSSIGTSAYAGESTASQIAPRMGLGWNLGNSLEVPEGETAWNNTTPTTKTTIDAVKAAGFNTLRIPTAWNSYADQTTYEIDPTWLARVKEVADYGIDNGMYVVINSHWDKGWLEENPNFAAQEEVNAKQYAYWTQVANYFESYDEHLLFAGTNEVRDGYGTPTAENIEVQESYNQTFIDAVRATGGNNATRPLIVQAYNTNIGHALNYFTMPVDTVADRLFLEVHHYDPYQFTLVREQCPLWGAPWADTGQVCNWGQEEHTDNLFRNLRNRFVSQGVPVIMGEYGAMKKHHLNGDILQQHIESREYYLEYVTNAAVENGVVPIYWDNGDNGEGGFAVFDRVSGNITDQGAIDALVAGAGGTSDPNAIFALDTSSNGSGTVTSDPVGTAFSGRSVVTLTATPDDNWVFTNWSGDITGTNNPYSFPMNNNVTAIANFVERVATDANGTILREWFSNVQGNSIAELRNNENYPDSPAGSSLLTSFEGPTNFDNIYGSRIRGYIHPQLSGEYTFWIAGDDHVELLLSTNDNPANATRIAYHNEYTSSRRWDKYPTQKSAKINLVAGRTYYIEALQNDGWGGDSLAVAWEGPNVPFGVISGDYLSDYRGETGGTDVSVTGVSVTPASTTLSTGESVALTATVTPANATNALVSWNSSNTNVATVSNTGVVNAINAGTATITATTADGSLTDSSDVTVEASLTPVTGVSVSAASLSMTEGATAQLTASVSPADASDQNVAWSTSNSAVATVNNSGLVTSVSAGTATITATTADGNFTANTAVTVEETVAPVISVTGVSVSETSLSMTEGDTAALTATVTPNDADNQAITWSSSNSNVAAVSANGVVTAGTAGNATITVTSNDGNYTASTAVTVEEAVAPVISVTGVSVSNTSLSLTEGDTAALTATVSPANASDQTVTWSTSNGNVASVSNTGVVTANNAGSATITATTADGGLTASTSVTIDAATVVVTGVSVSSTAVELNVGDTETLSATVTPANASNSAVTWTSSAPSVATVNNGVVTAVAAGTATITATTADSGFTATTAVTVAEVDTGGGTGGNDFCANPTPISLPFTHDGKGTFCWELTGNVNYTNSWNIEYVTINGVDYSGRWSNQMPATVDGKYYISYKGKFRWSHFEIK